MIRKSRISPSIRILITQTPELLYLYNKELAKMDNSYIKENGVYNHLKDAFDGIFNIKREVLCGNYWIDIVISNNNKKLAIEIDEYGHMFYNQQKEKERENYLRSQGYEIIRFNPDCEESNNILFLINYILKKLIKN